MFRQIGGLSSFIFYLKLYPAKSQSADLLGCVRRSLIRAITCEMVDSGAGCPIGMILLDVKGRLLGARRDFIGAVFAGAGLAGNPLAIVLDAEGLDPERMQRIAAEFNLSETVFVAPPENPIHTARVRIFTPRQELPFAGHPTV